jgi:hypothetical protein
MRAPATTETDTPEPAVSVLFFERDVHSRMVPSSPCSVAAISPRLAPGVSVMRSITPRMASAASSRSCGCWVLERFGEAFHLAPIDAGDIRVNVRDVDRCVGEALGHFVVLRFQVAKAGHEGTAIAAVLDGGDDLLELLLDVGEGLAVGGAGRTLLANEAVGLLGKSPHGLGRDLRRHEPMPEPALNGNRLSPLLTWPQVVTCLAGTMGQADATAT